jgi:F0F1-type ATP synthase membrane subunit b/b'
MPQFDFYTFFSQSIGILSAFVIFYFFFVYYYLPNFSEALKLRNKLLYKSKSIINNQNSSLFTIYLKEVLSIINK